MREPMIIGREDELEHLARWVADGPARVLLLHGPGGVGKTTLGRLAAHRHAGLFVSLEPCHDIDDVISALATALGVGHGVAPIAEELSDHAFVVLDNAEQVSQAVSALLDQLQGAGRFVVTSREPLHRADEQLLPIEPLSDSAATELFRARTGSLGAQLSAEATSTELQTLLRLLDGNPLAIELAAVRTRVMSVAQITERLGHRVDILRDPAQPHGRHGTLDACVEWSWNLLDDDLRQTLEQAALFGTSFTLPQAEDMMVADRWVGDALQLLVEHSLVQVVATPTAPRFAVYGAVRRFVERRGPPDAAHVERFVEGIARAVDGALTDELPWNVVRAVNLASALMPGRAATLVVKAHPVMLRAGFLVQQNELAARLASSDALHSVQRASLLLVQAKCRLALEQPAAEELLDHALELAPESEHQLRAQAYSLKGNLADIRFDHRRAEEQFERAQEALDALGEDALLDRINLFGARAGLALRGGGVERAIRYLDAALELTADLGDDLITARVSSWRVVALLGAGRTAEAAIAQEPALRVFRAQTDLLSLAHAEHQMGLALIDRDPAGAIEVLRTATTTAMNAGRHSLASSIRALVARVQGGPLAAAQLRDELAVLKPQAGHQEIASVWLGLGLVLAEQGALDDAATELAQLGHLLADRGNAREEQWVRSYLDVVNVLRGGEPAEPKSTFGQALHAVIDGATDVDLTVHDDTHLRLVFDFAPAPLRWAATLVSTTDRLEILDGGKRIVLSDGTEVDLSNRHLLRRLFGRLCDGHRNQRSVSSFELIEAGWPDESIPIESALTRLYTAVRSLRKLGLEHVIETHEDGYALRKGLTLVP